MNSALQQRVQHKVFAARAEKGAQPNTNTFILSTDKPDRDGDRLNQGQWDLAAYRKNPVVLYGHDARSLPIGKCTDIRVVDGKLKGTVEWPPAGVHPFADQVHAMVEGGFLNATSVGFRSLRSEPNAFGGRDHDALELCEWSIVPIGSNTDAQLERGIDQMKFKSWLNGRTHQREDDMDTEMYLEVSDDFFRKDLSSPDAFADMLAMMRQHVPADNEYLLMMSAQMARLGVDATIGDLCRAVMEEGVYREPKYFDVDQKELAVAISEVIASEVGKQTRAALCAAVGRLD